MERAFSFSRFSDGGLTIELARLIHTERGATSDVVACLAEFDLRRLYLPQGFSSMFTYCRDHLHLDEGAAYRRIEAARASRRFPEILTMLASGAVTLTNLVLIAHHLSEANHTELLAEITHKTKAQVEIIAARLKPKPDVPASVRRLRASAPIATATESAAANSPIPLSGSRLPVVPRPVIAPLAPQRFKLQITMDQETHDTLRQLQDLMRHSIPNGDPALIIERALKVLLQEVERRKWGALKRPRAKENASGDSSQAPAGSLH